MSKEALKKEIKQLCQSIIDSDLDHQASLMIHKMGKVYNHLLVYNYLNQQEETKVDLATETEGALIEVKEKPIEPTKEEAPSKPEIKEETNTQPETIKVESAPEKKEETEAPISEKIEIPEDKPAATVYERLAIKQQLSIGLNDKFAFIRDLFDGNAEDFRKVMEEINKFNNAEEAKSYFSLQVASQHSWGEEQEETIQRFLDIIERRV